MEDVLDGIGMAARLWSFTVEAGALERDGRAGDGRIGIRDAIGVAAAEVRSMCSAIEHLVELAAVGYFLREVPDVWETGRARRPILNY